VSISSATTSARIEANTMRHTGESTAPNMSVCGPTPGTAGSRSTSQNSPAMNKLTAAAPRMRARATCLPATLWTRSRRVKVKGYTSVPASMLKPATSVILRLEMSASIWAAT